MPITPKNVVKHELIGLKAKVINSTNKNECGLSGTIVNETRNIIVLNVRKREKRVQKKGRKFMIILPNKTAVKINGNLLVARPEDRTKRKLRRWK